MSSASDEGRTGGGGIILKKKEEEGGGVSLWDPVDHGKIVGKREFGDVVDRGFVFHGTRQTPYRTVLCAFQLLYEGIGRQNMVTSS